MLPAVLPASVREEIAFEIQSARIDPAVKTRLATLPAVLTALLARDPKLHVALSAHADRREGGDARKLVIGRAETVKGWLQAQGVPRERIRVSIRVEEEGVPLDNRRVSIRTVGADE